jgi:mRNA-degrading endonuclease toxin of MazEF toxin-antitoxin module
MKRGDLVIVDFGVVNPAASIRPALVIQNDRDNARMSKTIVAQITTNIRRAGENTQLLIDPGHTDWMQSGLKRSSVVNCTNLATIDQSDIRRIFGSLSPATMRQINDCLRSALAIP